VESKVALPDTGPEMLEPSVRPTLIWLHGVETKPLHEDESKPMPNPPTKLPPAKIGMAYVGPPVLLRSREIVVPGAREE
jgi:hypothetical protein